MLKKLCFAILFSLSYQTQAQQMALNLNFQIFPAAPVKSYAPIPLRESTPNAATSNNSAPVAVVPPLLLPHVPLALIAPKILDSPKLIVLPNMKVQSIGVHKLVFDNKNTPALTPVPAFEDKLLPRLTQDNLQLLPIVEIPPDELKMIHALLLLEFQKKYDVAMSLFIDLLQSAKYKTQALFHYAEIAYIFGLEAEYRSKMLQVLKNAEDKNLKRRAVESLVKNASAIKALDVEHINPLLSEAGVNANSSSSYLIKRAQFYLLEGDLTAAEQSLVNISAQTKNYNEARLLLAHINYRQGDLNTAVKNLETSLPSLGSAKGDKIKDLSYLTLARLYFQKGNYKQSYAMYLKIDKASPLWLQSTTEQALTQIMAKDYIGAAGNMFSLHTDYFKKAYAPESYIIRAVGYLNLCQFGDAISVVADLQGRYTKVLEQVQSFKNSHTQSTEYYQLVRDLFNHPEQSEVKAVPRSFILELARHSSFISIQKQINADEEELSQFNTISITLDNKAASLRNHIAQTKSEIKNNTAKKINAAQIPFLERKVLALEYELQLAQQGREKIEKMRILASQRTQNDKAQLKIEAGVALQKQFNFAVNKLNQIIEQKDVLAYEIYSGAGEHIRYQMAGGETQERSLANALTPEEKQSYKWKFKGEVWEDEIGHYRSSLTNVCAKEDYAKNTGGK